MIDECPLPDGGIQGQQLLVELSPELQTRCLSRHSSQAVSTGIISITFLVSSTEIVTPTMAVVCYTASIACSPVVLRLKSGTTSRDVNLTVWRPLRRVSEENSAIIATASPLRFMHGTSSLDQEI